MNTVYKYPIEIDDYVEIDLPEDAEILTFEMQHDKLCMWALVDPEKPPVTRKFRIAGTGHPIKEDLYDLDYLNTFLIGGDLVFHVFEVDAE